MTTETIISRLRDIQQGIEADRFTIEQIEALIRDLIAGANNSIV